MGTIVIPVFIEPSENAEEALATSEFKPIWDVLEALKSHDERLSDELDQLRIELGAKRRQSIGANDLTKIVFDLPTSVNEEFAHFCAPTLSRRRPNRGCLGMAICWVTLQSKQR
jgi:predicted helicase